MTPTRTIQYRQATPLARAVIDNLSGEVTGLSNQVLYKRRHPEYTSENNGSSPSLDIVATDVTIEFPGTRREMLRRLRNVGIKNSDIGGPFREGNLERWTYFQAPSQDSGVHQTSISIFCQPDRF